MTAEKKRKKICVNERERKRERDTDINEGYSEMLPYAWLRFTALLIAGTSV